MPKQDKASVDVISASDLAIHLGTLRWEKVVLGLTKKFWITPERQQGMREGKSGTGSDCLRDLIFSCLFLF